MTTFQLSSSLLQMTIVLHPSRMRHNGETGVDVQQGPVPRILFRLRRCINLFYCLLLIHIPWFLVITEEEAGDLACGHVRFLRVPGHHGLLTKGVIQPVFIKTEYLRECSASEFGLICISFESCLWSNVGFARLLCFAALRSALSAKAAPGELLRLCPSSDMRAAQ